MDDDDINDLIGAIYEAPLHPRQWEFIVSRLRVATKSRHAQLLCGRPDDNLETYTSSRDPYLGFDNETISFTEMMKCARHIRDTSIIDPHVQHFDPSKTPGAFFGRELLSPKVYKRSPFYNEFARQFGLFETLGGLVPDPVGVTYCVALARSERDALYDESDKRLLDVFLPHIQRSLKLHSRLEMANAQACVLRGAIDALTRATVLLDQRRKVIFLNEAAETLLKRCPELYVRRDRLCAARHADTLKLEKLIKGATNGEGKRSFGGVIAVQRGSWEQPLQVMAAPVPLDHRSRLMSGLGPVAMLIIHDPSAEVSVPHETLATMFGLTPVETRLVLALSRGQTLKDYGDECRVTQNTARTHLKSVFAKTKTSKQSDLVRLISGLTRSVALSH